ncbi:EAL domain-containing protein [Cellulomonas humilata]|uniref:EAL domain-containing protein n=1 Tax=Cellulomonas humilata TaxID=144055 RepID=A0A7Y6DVR1_9CELL|nr:EAL domain-containing protein [Cellulomonas humilata]NUU15803.1 EAL domain-containing protein [Cellulomonas humilata]
MQSSTSASPRAHTAGDGSCDLSAELARILDDRAVTVRFHPVIELATGDVVGLKASAHGPDGSPLHLPADLFAAAAVDGRTGELDWVCRAMAFRAFLAAELPPSMSLFVTMEPEALAVPCPLDLAGIVSVAESRLRVFVGINERELALDPGGLLAAADRAVNVGWGIAIEDVGASRAPLALLPVVGADLITLDLRLLVQRTDDDAAAITLAVLQQVELTGAALLVEGVESEADLQWARALGATYGRGSHLGDATAITERLPAPRTVVPMLARADVDAPFASPFDLVADAPNRRASEANLSRLMQAVYRTALTPGAAPVILAGGGRSDQPDESSAEGFPAPATMPLLLVLFGTGLPQEPLPGLRGVRVRRDDPLAADRFLIVLSEAGAFAVLARSDRADPGREVEIVLTQDPDLVHSMARQLIRRIPSSGGSNDALPGPETPASGPEVTVDGHAPDGDAAPGRGGWRSRLGRRV